MTLLQSLFLLKHHSYVSWGYSVMLQLHKPEIIVLLLLLALDKEKAICGTDEFLTQMVHLA